MNQPNQPKKGGKNWSAGITIVGLTVVLGILMFATFTFFLSGDGFSLPTLNLQLGWIGILFAVFAVIFLATGYAGFYVGKSMQWRVILWMARKLYETKRQGKGKKKRRTRKTASLSSRLNPMTSVPMPEESKLPFGSMKFEAGEKFLGPLFFPSWEVYTFWPYGWSTILLSLILALSIAVLSNIWHPGVWVVPIGTLIWFAFQVIRYWGQEWRRMTEFGFITTNKYGKGRGDWSTLRFLTGHGFDAEVTDINIGNVVKVTTDPIPNKWGIKVNKLLELYIESLADSDERVGSVFIEGVAGKGTMLLPHYRYAPWIKILIESAAQLSATLKGDNQRIEGVAALHKMGKPGQRNNYAQLESEAKAWKNQQHMRLGITEPQVVDLWSLYLQYLERLVNHTNTPSTPTPTAAAASVPARLPGQPVSRPQPPEEDEEPQAPPDPVV